MAAEIAATVCGAISSPFACGMGVACTAWVCCVWYLMTRCDINLVKNTSDPRNVKTTTMPISIRFPAFVSNSVTSTITPLRWLRSAFFMVNSSKLDGFKVACSKVNGFKVTYSKVDKPAHFHDHFRVTANLVAYSLHHGHNTINSF
jgi:hypothetical protein